MLSKKRKLEEHKIVELIKDYSTLIQNKLHAKLKNLGSFAIPCLIGNNFIDCASCDIGSSVSLMPFSLYKKLDLEEMRPHHLFTIGGSFCKVFCKYFR